MSNKLGRWVQLDPDNWVFWLDKYSRITLQRLDTGWRGLLFIDLFTTVQLFKSLRAAKQGMKRIAKDHLLNKIERLIDLGDVLSKDFHTIFYD